MPHARSRWTSFVADREEEQPRFLFEDGNCAEIHGYVARWLGPGLAASISSSTGL